MYHFVDHDFNAEMNDVSAIGPQFIRDFAMNQLDWTSKLSLDSSLSEISSHGMLFYRIAHSLF